MRYVLTLLVTLTAGCGTTSSNYSVGTQQSYASLADQRAASQLPVASALPAGARRLGVIDAARCHRNFTQTAPREEDLIADLKTAAYARGADGIAEVQISKASGLAQNCWYMLSGQAIAYASK